VTGSARRRLIAFETEKKKEGRRWRPTCAAIGRGPAMRPPAMRLTPRGGGKESVRPAQHGTFGVAKLRVQACPVGGGLAPAPPGVCMWSPHRGATRRCSVVPGVAPRPTTTRWFWWAAVFSRFLPVRGPRRRRWAAARGRARGRLRPVGTAGRQRPVTSATPITAERPDQDRPRASGRSVGAGPVDLISTSMPFLTSSIRQRYNAANGPGEHRLFGWGNAMGETTSSSRRWWRCAMPWTGELSDRSRPWLFVGHPPGVSNEEAPPCPRNA